MALEALISSTVAIPVKRKRSKRPRILATTDDDDQYLARSLFLLAHSCGGADAINTTKNSPTTTNTTPFAVENVEAENVEEGKPDFAEKLSCKCNLCNKTFSSYQALGGHKTSHRVKPTTTNTNTNTANNYNNPSQSISGNTVMAATSNRAYECFFCHKVFPTGQALGGHKRRHYEGNLGPATRSSVTSSDGGNFTTHTSRHFDLNFPALPELNLESSLEFPTKSQSLGYEEVESPVPEMKPTLSLSL